MRYGNIQRELLKQGKRPDASTTETAKANQLAGAFGLSLNPAMIQPMQVMQLQRLIGNRAVGAMLSGGTRNILQQKKNTADTTATIQRSPDTSSSDVKPIEPQSEIEKVIAGMAKKRAEREKAGSDTTSSDVKQIEPQSEIEKVIAGMAKKRVEREKAGSDAPSSDRKPIEPQSEIEKVIAEMAKKRAAREEVGSDTPSSDMKLIEPLSEIEKVSIAGPRGELGEKFDRKLKQAKILHEITRRREERKWRERELKWKDLTPEELAREKRKARHEREKARHEKARERVEITKKQEEVSDTPSSDMKTIEQLSEIEKVITTEPRGELGEKFDRKLKQAENLHEKSRRLAEEKWRERELKWKDLTPEELAREKRKARHEREKARREKAK